MTDMDLTTDYLNRFDAFEYLRVNFTDSAGDRTEGDFRATILRFFHEFFAENSIKGKRLLDVGTGPTIYSTISACPHVDNIFLSDYVPQNREALSRWLNGTLDHSFENIFRWVIDKEGKRETPEKRERDLRSKVTGILAVDVRQGNPLAPSSFPQFDVITTCLCLDAVATDEKAYEQLCANTATLLKKDGLLIIISALGTSFYSVGQTKFGLFKFNPDIIKRTWIKLGFKIVSCKEGDRSCVNQINSDFTGIFGLLVKKLKD